jgi:hypothetical protein
MVFASDVRSSRLRRVRANKFLLAERRSATGLVFSGDPQDEPIVVMDCEPVSRAALSRCGQLVRRL